MLSDSHNLTLQLLEGGSVCLRKRFDQNVQPATPWNEQHTTQFSQPSSNLVTTDYRVPVLTYNDSNTTIRKKGSDRSSLEVLGAESLP